MAVSLRFPLFGLIIAVESFERKENTDQSEQRGSQFMRLRAAAAVLIWSR